jgi:hypothetical protein
VIEVADLFTGEESAGTVTQLFSFVADDVRE